MAGTSNADAADSTPRRRRIKDQEQQRKHVGKQKPSSSAASASSNQKPPPSFGKKKKSKDWTVPVTPSTLPAMAILLLALVTGLVWNRHKHHQLMQKMIPPDAQIRDFLELICEQPDVTCHSGLVPSGRTQAAAASAKEAISPNELILKMPRRFQIWDLDALRDDFVREHLLLARMESSSLQQQQQQPLGSAAFLAAYLARLIHKMNNKHDNDELNEVMRAYLSILPTYQDFKSFHPILWEPDESSSYEIRADPFSDLRHTSTLDMVATFRELLFAEYDAFARASSLFADQVSRHDYLAARLAVQTRAFGTGPIIVNAYEENEDEHKNNDTKTNDAQQSSSISLSEMLYYQQQAGVSLSNGCFAMVPVLDLYDHHAHPNVAFGYKKHQQAFVITSIATIPPTYQVFDSYGKRTDSDLFARYGFTNGDGSDYTQTKIAMHKIHSGGGTTTTLPITKSLVDSMGQTIVQYLIYDDGYEDCVSPSSSDPEAWDMKLLKYKFLLARVQMEAFWVAILRPRGRRRKSSSSSSSSSQEKLVIKPPRSSDDIAEWNDGSDDDSIVQPPTLDRNNLSTNATHIFSTCRLLSLTHLDYNGRAAQMLQDHLYDDAFILPSTQDALEYRTLFCMARLATIVLSRFGITVDEQYNRVLQLQNKNGNDNDGFKKKKNKKSLEWTAAYIRLGEMQALQALKEMALMKLRQEPFVSMERGSTVALSMRDNPCPKELLLPLKERVRDEIVDE